MATVVIICAVVVIALLLFIASIRIEQSELSAFELERRKRAGKDASEKEVLRMEYFADLLSLQRVILSLLLVLSVLLLTAGFGWFVGIVLSVLLALEYGAVARLDLLNKFAQPQYDNYENTIIRFIERYPLPFRLLRNLSSPQFEQRLHSRDELLHLVSTSGTLIDANEKMLIKHGLSFNERVVREIMTPRSVIDSVKKTEILGPLVLDDLHKTGHSRFPVIDGDLDHVVGVLMLRDVLHVDSSKKHTSKVESAMSPRVFYIHEDQALDHALAAFLKARHHLFVVVNEYRETVGILTLEDVIETLLGRKIIDEFDTHEDLRIVAERNPRGNNTPSKATDV